MLPKTPTTPKLKFWSFVKGGAKTLFVLEAIGFVACYGVYYRMNTNREFRQHINENYPFMLDYYYKIGEVFGNNKARQADAAIWDATAIVNKSD